MAGSGDGAECAHGNNNTAVTMRRASLFFPTMVSEGTDRHANATAEYRADAACALRRGEGVLPTGANFDEAQLPLIEPPAAGSTPPPFDHPMVTVWAARHGVELLQQDAHLDCVFVPVNGGGGLTLRGAAIKQRYATGAIAVEAEDRLPGAGKR